jgi:small nuclear ribonucleoprotein
MLLPIEMLKSLSNCKTCLLLKDGRTLKGKLIGWDQFMNIVLEGAEERNGDSQRRLGTILLRGNNVVSISLP